MVSQALYWLGQAGQEELIGPVVVMVLVREVAPLLVGFILLGRSGVVVVSEIGELQIGGQVSTLAARRPSPIFVGDGVRVGMVDRPGTASLSALFTGRMSRSMEDDLETARLGQSAPRQKR
jgi:hypothetical protein